MGATTTQFLYDGLNLVQELASGTPTANLLTGLTIDETFTRAVSGGVETLLVDALGSTVALADGSGAVQTEYTYEPFGATSVSGTSSTNAAQFTGRENDGTGLYAYRFRYHAPHFARFISEDPLGVVGPGESYHTYVGNRPTGGLDPLGLQYADINVTVGLPLLVGVTVGVMLGADGGAYPYGGFGVMTPGVSGSVTWSTRTQVPVGIRVYRRTTLDSRVRSVEVPVAAGSESSGSASREPP